MTPLKVPNNRNSPVLRGGKAQEVKNDGRTDENDLMHSH